MIEKWKPIPQWEHYAVSSLGKVKRLTAACGTFPGRILKQGIRRGYLYVDLHCPLGHRKFHTHRLVAMTFLGPIPEGKQCNHINGKKLDNRACNLEYVTISENQLHAIKNGLAHPPPLPPPRRGEANNLCSITEHIAQQILDSPLHGYGYAVTLAKQFSISVDIVRQIKNRVTWRHLQPTQ